MPRWNRFPPPSRPRKVEGGIALRAKRGAIGETWWSARFVAALESLAIGSRLQRGKSYARGGQVLALHVEIGRVSARVQGSRSRPYDVVIDVKPLRDADWSRVERKLAEQALFSARLLAGEMPLEIEDVFAALQLSLFPARADDLVTSCSCPDFANPCKHIAASFYILAEAFDDDPFLIFHWRGMPRAELISSLRSRRGTPLDDGAAAEAAPESAAAEAALESAGGAGAAGSRAGAATAAGDAAEARAAAAESAGDAGVARSRAGATTTSGQATPAGAATAAAEAIASTRDASLPSTAAPLAASLGAFWRVGESFDGVHAAPHTAETAGALLRQLGPPPKEAGGALLFDQLLGAYSAMADGAERLAFAESADRADRPASAEPAGGAERPASAEPADDADRRRERPRAEQGRLSDGTRARQKDGTRARRKDGRRARKEDGSRARKERDAAKRARYFVADIRHFEEDGEPAAEMPRPARRLYEFFTAIVRTATSLADDEPARTALKCRRRLGRAPCRGHLFVNADIDACQIAWRCDTCGEAGELTGWELSSHDLGGRYRDVCDHGERWVVVTLPEPAYRELERLDVLDVTAEQLIRGATLDGDLVRLEGCSGDFDALDAEIAAVIERSARAAAARWRSLRRQLGA